MKWVKQYSDSDFHPQIQLAGFWGARVFEVLTRISGQYDLDGHIPPQHLHPEVLARRLQATDILPLQEAAKAIGAAIERLCSPEVGLLVRLDDGGVLIDGWERIQGDKSTERVRRHRARRAAAEDEAKRQWNEQAPLPVDAKQDVTVTSRVETPETLKRREEERRGEAIDPPPNPPHCGGGEPSASPGDAKKPIREAAKRAKKASREPSPGAAKVLERMAELVGCAYGYSSTLEARLREGVPVEDCLAVVEHLAADPWWREKRFVSAEAPFRRDKFDSYLAQARAVPRKPSQPRSPPAAPAPPMPPEGARSGGLCPACASSVGFLVRRGRKVWDEHPCAPREWRMRWGVILERDPEADDDAPEVSHATG